MYYELSKRDKKVARRCIDKGIEAEFKEGLEQFEEIIAQWREGKFATNKDAYHELFKAVDKKDYAIGRRYDRLSGSRWLMTVTQLLHEGYISEDDIKDFSEETKVAVSRYIHFLKGE